MGHRDDAHFQAYVSATVGFDSQSVVHGREQNKELVSFVRAISFKRTLSSETTLENEGVAGEDRGHKQTYPKYTTIRSIHSAQPEQGRFSRAILRYDNPRRRLIDLFFGNIEPSLQDTVQPLYQMAKPDQEPVYPNHPPDDDVSLATSDKYCFDVHNWLVLMHGNRIS
jgi:hypothetical protein